MNRFAILFILILLFASSCTQKRYGHLTLIKQNKSKTEQVKKNALQTHLAIDLKRDSVQFDLLSRDLGVMNIREDVRPMKFLKLKQMVYKVVPKSALLPDIKKLKQTPNLLKEKSAEKSVEPKQTQSFAEVIGIILVVGLVSFLAAAIATIFGMAYWTAFWMFFIASSILLLLGTLMDS